MSVDLVTVYTVEDADFVVTYDMGVSVRVQGIGVGHQVDRCHRTPCPHRRCDRRKRP